MKSRLFNKCLLTLAALVISSFAALGTAAAATTSNQQAINQVAVQLGAIKLGLISPNKLDSAKKLTHAQLAAALALGEKLLAQNTINPSPAFKSILLLATQDALSAPVKDITLDLDPHQTTAPQVAAVCIQRYGDTKPVLLPEAEIASKTYVSTADNVKSPLFGQDIVTDSQGIALNGGGGGNYGGSSGGGSFSSGSLGSFGIVNGGGSAVTNATGQ